jgi:hypothetical protein
MSELARLLAEVHPSPAVYALIYRPSGAAAGWERTDLWEAAARLPGVRVMTDEGGVQAHAFGALVSGQALLYDEAGALQFSGGITGARGHEGDNPGRFAVGEFLNGRQPAVTRTAAFGCLLHSEADARAGAALVGATE